MLVTQLAAWSEAEVSNASKIPPHSTKNKKVQISPVIDSFRGWDYLVAKLRKDGISELELRAVYLNRQMPPFSTAYFKLVPKESHAMYSSYKKESLVKRARDFIENHKSIFDEAEKKYKVNRHVIASIMLIESRYGSNTGDHLIINRLSRVGSIAKPDNILANYKKLKKENPRVTLKQVEERAHYLESRFYPEVLALFEMSRKQNINLLTLKGSSAGAFGIPQFLPSTYLKHGVDANNDGHISLFDIEDAVHSTSKYLASEGWQDNAPKKQKEAVIWEYNHSGPYIDTVLSIADRLAER